MILVDTSIWVDHFKRGNARLKGFLMDGEVACHGFVIGELALGNLANRPTLLQYLSNLPSAPMAEHHEVLALVDRRGLSGTGLGWVDVHLLASALIAQVPVWTLDRRLEKEARRCGIAHAPS